VYSFSMMEYFNVWMTFRAGKVGNEVVIRLLSIIYVLHVVICSPDQLSSAVPAVHLPWPLYLFLALLREVAEYLLCCPLPCRVFLGFDSIETPILNVFAISCKFQLLTRGDSEIFPHNIFVLYLPSYHNIPQLSDYLLILPDYDGYDSDS